MAGKSARSSSDSSKRVRSNSAVPRWFRSIRATHGLDQSEFAAKIGYSRSSIASFESNDREPSAAVINAIKKVFPDAPPFPDDEASIKAIHPDNLSRAERQILNDGMVAIPVWRGTIAGENDECTFDDAFEEPKEVAGFFTQGHPEIHVLCIVSGHSMEPRLNDRERALVRLDPDVGPGHLVIARNPDARNYIKRMVLVGGRIELHSFNDLYPPIASLTGWTIKGGVTAIFKHYEPGASNIEWDDGRYLRA